MVILIKFFVEAKAVRPVPKPRPSVDPKAIREEAEKGQSFLAVSVFPFFFEI